MDIEVLKKSRKRAMKQLFVDLSERLECVAEYDLDEMIQLSLMQEDVLSTENDEEFILKQEKIREFMNHMQPKDTGHTRITLWKEGNMPIEVPYEDNGDYRYNHNPDFIPTMNEILVDEDKEVKGAIVLCTGGDHGRSCVPGYQICKDLNRKGYQVFLLRNRVARLPYTAKESGADAARAIQIVRKNADKYRINPEYIFFAGFSNGGLTGENCIQYFSTHTIKEVFEDYEEDEVDTVSAAMAGFICIYGPRFVDGTFDYDNAKYPPVFFGIGREDKGAMANFNATYYDLIGHGVQVEAHTFAGTPHGVAGANLYPDKQQYPNFQLWIDLADYFMMDLCKVSK